MPVWHLLTSAVCKFTRRRGCTLHNGPRRVGAEGGRSIDWAINKSHLKQIWLFFQINAYVKHTYQFANTSKRLRLVSNVWSLQHEKEHFEDYPHVRNTEKLIIHVSSPSHPKKKTIEDLGLGFRLGSSTTMRLLWNIYIYIYIYMPECLGHKLFINEGKKKPSSMWETCLWARDVDSWKGSGKK
jgi:hypothetical protein